MQHINAEVQGEEILNGGNSYCKTTQTEACMDSGPASSETNLICRENTSHGVQKKNRKQEAAEEM